MGESADDCWNLADLVAIKEKLRQVGEATDALRNLADLIIPEVKLI